MMRPVAFEPRMMLDGASRPLGAVLAVAAVALLVMPVFSTFGELLTNAAMASGVDQFLGMWVAPAEARIVHGVLTLLGYASGADGAVLSLSNGTSSTSLYISWNCVGWQTLLFLGVSMIAGLQGQHSRRSRLEVVALGIIGIAFLNVVRITVVGLVALHFGQLPAIIVHDHGSVVATVLFLIAFWTFAYNVILEPQAKRLE